jgi:multiple sugar transport system permease protein
MLMAALQSISDEVYEAASLDGASSWAQFSKITLGILAPVNKVLFTTMFLWSFNDFATPFVMFGALPPSSADIAAIHIYGSSFVNWNFGLGSAMSTLVLIFLAIMTFVIGKTMNRVSSDA